MFFPIQMVLFPIIHIKSQKICNNSHWCVRLQVLTPTQVARLLVQSYPWLPDMLSITSWAAYELGDTNVIGTLASQSAQPGAPITFLRDL